MSDVAVSTSVQSAAQSGDDARAIGWWLLAVAGLVFIMVVVGGATRLTESGLSMVDWRPVTGMLPPITEADWQAEFAKYQQSPEYRLKNRGMSITQFKEIFYWEWGHRLLGRVIGLAFFVPMVWFWLRRRVPPGYKPRLVLLFLLGGSQGLLGWYMVQSGLVDEPAVSHYRLTAHLSLALVIFSALMWTALSLLRPRPLAVDGPVPMLARLALALAAVQIVMGALVAGLKAGLIYNQWPLMGEGLVPPALYDMAPLWRNFLDNAVTVQFDHRMGAYLLFALSLVLGWFGIRHGGPVRTAVLAVFVPVTVQMLLGVVALLLAVPVFWGAAHQAGGVIVLASLIYLVHRTRTPG